MPSVSVIILTFNEELNLPKCLESVKGWASEVFVVDSFSTDRTVDIARARSSDGVRVVQHAFENYGAQWNWAIERLPLTSEWVLKLDADERVTAEFIREVDQVTRTANRQVHGLYFRRHFYLMEQRLRWSGRLPFDLRLWRRGMATMEPRSVNEHLVVAGDVGFLRTAVQHSDQRPISDWIDKHNRYSSLEAQNSISKAAPEHMRPRLFGSPPERRMWFKRAYQATPAGPGAYFIFLYLVRLGILDGRIGLTYCMLRTQYLYWINVKIREFNLRGVTPVVMWPTRGQPHPDVVNTELQRHCDRLMPLSDPCVE